MSNNLIDPEKIHLQSIRVINGNINSDIETDEFIVSAFDTTFDLDQGIDIQNKATRFLFTVKLDALDQTNNILKINAKFTIEFVFTVENLEDFVITKDENNNILFLNAALGGTLMGIVYSTTRGIILTRTQGTVMDGAILPVIDPQKLLPINDPVTI